MNDNNLLLTDRQQKILSLIKARDYISISELVMEFGLSESTIKRELRVLQSTEKLERTRGGAFVPTDSKGIMPYEVRIKTNYDQKLRIAQCAARFIADEDYIYLDGGSTTYLVFKNIRAKNVTVLTNSAAILSAAGPNSPQVHVLPGEYVPKSMTIRGTATLEAVSRIRLQKVIMGAAFIHPEYGILCKDVDDKVLKAKLIEQSEEAILVADSSKLGLTGPWHITGLDAISTFITDGGLTDDMRDSLSSKVKNLVIV
jgi:DeoR/GlpR family transcriptional regulator of sugar metabolism